MSASFTFSERSRRNLLGVHPDLVRVAELALELSTVDFVVIEGMRTLEQQKANVASGVSSTMNSRHLTGHAIDVMALDPATGEGTWEPWALYEQIAGAFKQASKQLGVPVKWGGEWQMRDGVHFQLTFDAYPLQGQHVPSKPRVVGKAAATAAAGAIPAAVSVAEYVSEVAGKAKGISEILTGLPLWSIFFGLMAAAFGTLWIKEVLKRRDQEGS